MPSNYVEGEIVEMNFDGVMVFLAVLISAVGAFATLTTAAYIRLVRNSRWYFVLLLQCGLGLGVCTVWAMHFVAMRSIALRGGEDSGASTTLPMSFDLITTGISALLAWMLCTIAVHVALGRKAADQRAVLDGEASIRLPAASVILAVGIGVMHYVGLLAERGPFLIYLDGGLIMASIAVALISSLGIVILIMYLPNKTKWRLGGALVIAMLASGVHFFALLPLAHRAHPVGWTWRLIFQPAEVRAEVPVIVALVLDVVLMAGNAFYLEVIQVRDRDFMERELQHLSFVAGAKGLMMRCKQMQFPMAVVRATEFIRLGKLVPHETLRDKKLLLMLDAPSAAAKLRKKGCILFFSHQWLSTDVPDPAGQQFGDMSSAIQEFVQARRLKTDSIFVWVDYCSIPQRSAQQQQLAVNSLPAYVAACSEFVVVAPQVLHSSTKVPCNFTSYSGRFWCRLEVFCALMCAMSQDHSADNMLITRRVSERTIRSYSDEERMAAIQPTATHSVSALSALSLGSSATLDDSLGHKQRIYLICEGRLQPLLFLGAQGLKEDFVELLHVYEGRLDCCKRGHRTASGEEVPCDKHRVVDTLTGLYGTMVVQLLKMRKAHDPEVVQQSLVQLGDTLVQKRHLFFPEEYFGTRIEAVHQFLSTQSRGKHETQETKDKDTRRDDAIHDVDALLLELDAALAHEDSSVRSSISDLDASHVGPVHSSEEPDKDMDDCSKEEHFISM